MNILVEIEAHQRLISFLVYALGIIAILRCLSKPLQVPERKSVSFALLVIAVAVIACLGTYPIEWGLGTDRANYASRFLSAQSHGINLEDVQHDKLFYALTRALSFVSVETYFIVIAALYVGFYVLGCRRMVGSNAILLFVAVVLSMGFVGYAINTLRAGLAFSLVIMGMAYSKNIRIMAICFICAALIHFSSAIPVAAFLLSKRFGSTRGYFMLWLLAVPVSFVAGDTFNTLLSELTIDDRTSYLTQENAAYRQGFRIDFILYSALPLLVGYWYIFKAGFKSRLYHNIYNTYIIANALWVLVVRANFTDRIAYLSWFLIPFVLAYPILRSPEHFKSPNLKMGAILAGELAFMMLL